jgi:hypothetical protein
LSVGLEPFFGSTLPRVWPARFSVRSAPPKRAMFRASLCWHSGHPQFANRHYLSSDRASTVISATNADHLHPNAPYIAETTHAKRDRQRILLFSSYERLLSLPHVLTPPLCPFLDQLIPPLRPRPPLVLPHLVIQIPILSPRQILVLKLAKPPGDDKTFEMMLSV